MASRFDTTRIQEAGGIRGQIAQRYQGPQTSQPPVSPSADPPPAPSAPPPSPSAFDLNSFVSGWTDPSKGYRTPGDFQNYIQQGGYGSHVKAGGSKGDKLFDMNDKYLGDFVKAAGLGGQGAIYISPEQEAAQNAAPGAGAGASNPFNDQIRQLLMQQLGQVGQPVSANDPLIEGELQSHERGLERNRQDLRGAMAERMAFTGLNSGGQGSGAFETGIQQGYEQKGEALTGIRSQLFNRERESRRQNMTQLLNMALASGDMESARQIQLLMHNDNYGLNRADLELRGNAMATDRVIG